jgi:hypothetical protein
MKLRSLALAASMMLVAPSAIAINAVDLVFRGAGTEVSTATASVSSIVIADVVLTADTLGISGVGISIAFDAAELQYQSGVEFTSVNLPGMGNVFAPLQIGFTLVDNSVGLLEGFDQADLSGLGLVSSTATIGSMKFHVGALVNDNTDIDIIANSNGLADGFVDSVGGNVNNVVFNGASVVPEAGAVSLGALALATLLALKRRRS